jgi:predicted DCC family thiol-disulfide oxidoreductase YuxK
MMLKHKIREMQHEVWNRFLWFGARSSCRHLKQNNTRKCSELI